MKESEQKCGSCAFRQRQFKKLGTCDYLSLTGKMRGCYAENCIRYIKTTPEIDKKVDFIQKRNVDLIQNPPLAYLVEDVPNEPTPVPKRSGVRVRIAGIETVLRGEHLMEAMAERDQKYYRKNAQRVREREKKRKEERKEK